MANVKKNTTEEVEVEDINNESVEEKVDNKVEKRRANDELAALKEQNERLQEQIDTLMKMMMMNAQSSTNANANLQGGKNSLLDEVKIVHLFERGEGLTTHIELSNMSIDLRSFGEERTLDRRQAEELAGKCRKLFENGIIAFGEGCEDIAKKFSLKSVDSYKYVNSQFIASLGMMDAVSLEKLYNQLCEGHRAFIIEYFKRKILAKDSAFCDAQKIEMLNRVSNGAMSDVLTDRNRDAANEAAGK